MPWDDLSGHEDAIDRFRRSIVRNRLASTYLFVGPAGVGKHTFALKLAQALLCSANPPQELEACGNCPSCQQVSAKTHPDLILISKPADKAFIPVETFIGDREHRRQRGLCHDIGLKPFMGGRKIAIIDDADFLNQESANCLLKTLEEPPPNSLLMLIGTSEQRQLSTIVSRSQVVRFSALSNEQVANLLNRMNDLESDLPIDELAAASNGSVTLAVQLSESEVYEFRKQLYSHLTEMDPQWNGFTKAVIGFVDAAGKDGATKRARLALIGDLAIEFYRQGFLAATGSRSEGVVMDAVMANAVDSFVQNSDGLSGEELAERCGLCIHRCGDFQQQIAANVSPANAVDAWLRDLSRLGRGLALV
jgi:DNA polymerase-3 subunit delta'